MMTVADRGMLIALEVEHPRLAALQPLCPETLLADSAARVAVVAPAEGPFHEVAGELATAFARLTGHEPVLLDEAEFLGAESLPASLVAVGHAANNWLLRRLHYLGYLENADYPAAGLQVTSVHNPFGDGHNVLCALGVTPEVAGASARRLLECAVAREGQWLIPGRLQIVEPRPATPDPEAILAESARLTPDSSGRPDHFRQCLRHLRRTGEERWARAFVTTLRPYATGYLPLSFVRMSAVDFWTDEVVRNWDACEEFDFFTDEERLLATNFVAALGQYCHDSLTYQKWRILPEEHQIFNHHTFPAVGLFTAALYLQTHGYDLPEVRGWLDKALQVMARAATAGRSFDEGGSGYSWLVASHLLRVSFAVGDFSYARGPRLHQYAELAAMVLNNDFETVPYGDCGAYHARSPLAADLLLEAAQWHDDPGLLWVARQHQPEHAAADIFTRDWPGAPPERHVGLFVLPMDPVIHRWMHLPRFPGYPDPPLKPNVPVAEGFDKLTCRGAWSPEADYLLLQGFGDGQHGHPDANALSQYQARGRLFLVDNDYIRRWPRQHNMVMVLREGQHAPIPTTARLDHTERFTGGALTQTSLLGYNGCDWTRTLLWLSGDCVLVVDRLHAREDGDYELKCFWRSLGEAELTPQGLHVEQAGEHFHVLELTRSERRLDVEPGPVNSTSYPEYRHGDSRPKILTETQCVGLAAGEEACFVNLLLPNGPAAAPRRQMTWGEGGEVRVAGEGGLFTVTAAGCTLPDGRHLDFPPTGRLGCLLCRAQPSAPPSVSASTPPGGVLWTVSLPGAATALASAPDGATVVGCAGGHVLHLSASGQIRALAQAAGRVGAVACGSVFGETTPSVLVAADDAVFRLLDLAGGERLRVDLPRGPHMPAWGTALALADLDGDGRLWPIVGTASWRVHAVTPEGHFRWTFDTAAHAVTAVTPGDLNGDGREEIAVGTVYFCVPAINAEGGRLWEDEDYNDFWTAGPIFPYVVVADVDADGEAEVVTVGSDALVHCIDCRGVKKWATSVGDEATGLVNAAWGLAAAMVTGEVHLLDGRGRRQWRARLGAPCTALALDGTRLCVALETGLVLWLDAGGEVVARVALPAPATRLLASKGRVAAAMADGQLAALQAL